MSSAVLSCRRLAALAVLAVLVALTAAVPAGAAERYRDDVFPQVSETRDLQYGEAPGADGRPQALRLDLYEPALDRKRQRRAVVWVHGGGFTGGDKASAGDRLVSTRLARKGFVTVSINYRLLGVGAGIAAAQYDAQAAVRWLRANARRLRIDRRAISIAGASAGAITALRVAYNSEDPGTSGTPGRSSKVAAAVADAGAALGTDVDPGEPPALLLHGTADRVLPYRLALEALFILRAGGVEADLVTYEGVGHTALFGRFEEAFAEMTGFLADRGSGRR